MTLSTFEITVPFEVGERVRFIVNHQMRDGVITRFLFDGVTVRVDIAKEHPRTPLWSIPIEQVAKY